MRHLLALFAFAFGMSFLHAARASEYEALDNRVVIEALSDAIWGKRTSLPAEGKLTINGESKGACSITSHQDDKHHGHVYQIRQAAQVIAYSTIWAQKSRLSGRIQKLARDNERRIFVEIDNGGTALRSEVMNVNRRNKRLSLVISHEFSSGNFRNATCVLE